MKSLHQLARQRALPSLVAPRFQSPRANQLWQRSFSAIPAASEGARLDPSKLTITKTSTPKELLPSKDLVFGKTFTGMVVLGAHSAKDVRR